MMACIRRILLEENYYVLIKVSPETPTLPVTASPRGAKSLLSLPSKPTAWSPVSLTEEQVSDLLD